MKTQQIMQSPVAKKMYNLKLKTAVSVLNGRCRDARVAQKEFAKLAVDNFATAINLPSPVEGSFDLFSDYGLNIIKFKLFKLFTRKTPEEKKLEQMVDDYKAEILFDINQ